MILKQTGTPIESYFKQVAFTGSHDRAIEALKKNRVEAAFVASGRIDEALRQGKLSPDDYVVILASEPIPYDPFVMQTRLCPALAAKIKQVFLGDTSDLKPMFEALHMTGFVPVGDADYREIRALFVDQP